MTSTLQKILVVFLALFISVELFSQVEEFPVPTESVARESKARPSILNKNTKAKNKRLNENSETWYRELAIIKDTNNFSDNVTVFLYPQNILLDNQQNAVIGFSIVPRKNYLADYSDSSFHFTELRGQSIYAKYDIFGNIVWVNSIGGQTLYFQDSHFILDSKGDLIIFGQYKYQGHFDEDTIATDKNDFYLAKLDGTSGDVLWVKVIATTDYSNSIVTDKITLDHEDNIYLTFLYFDFSVTVDNLSLNADRSPINAMAKFTPEGGIIWLKNTTAPWLDYYGRTHVFNFNELDQTLSAIQSQGFYYTMSSCNYKNWYHFVQTFDLDGNLLDTLEIEGSDLGSLTVGILNNEGRLFCSGYYRDHISLGRFSANSSRYESCFKFEGFNFIYDLNIQEVVHGQSTNNQTFYPFDIAKDESFIYQLGSDEDFMLTLLKYTHKGQFVGYKNLNQRIDPLYTTYGFNVYLDVTEDYIVIFGRQFKEDSTTQVFPVFNGVSRASVLKIENNNWITNETWILDLNELDENDHSDLLISPNPFINYIDIIYNGEQTEYTDYEIIDINGKIVLQNKLSYYHFKRIDLYNLAYGVYTIRLYGEKNSISKKIVKINAY
jgi:hypothetical protein